MRFRDFIIAIWIAATFLHSVNNRSDITDLEKQVAELRALVKGRA
jgi:hypothetical protein